ncbi:MAG: hypothetical protein M0T84_07260 [Betaproteobacteria bacterium]|nr:hypothetical protein [Betaproteobacteria bacterium]
MEQTKQKMEEVQKGVLLHIRGRNGNDDVELSLPYRVEPDMVLTGSGGTKPGIIVDPSPELAKADLRDVDPEDVCEIIGYGVMEGPVFKDAIEDGEGTPFIKWSLDEKEYERACDVADEEARRLRFTAPHYARPDLPGAPLEYEEIKGTRKESIEDLKQVTGRFQGVTEDEDDPRRATIHVRQAGHLLRVDVPKAAVSAIPRNYQRDEPIKLKIDRYFAVQVETGKTKPKEIGRQ